MVPWVLVSVLPLLLTPAVLLYLALRSSPHLKNAIQALRISCCLRQNKMKIINPWRELKMQNKIWKTKLAVSMRDKSPKTQVRPRRTEIAMAFWRRRSVSCRFPLSEVELRPLRAQVNVRMTKVKMTKLNSSTSPMMRIWPK